MGSIITPAEAAEKYDLGRITDAYHGESERNRYVKFLDNEGIPSHAGLFVEDINAVETAKWDRTGQRGAFVNLYGSEGVVDLQIHELEPSGETKTQHHLYEEVVYVTKGNGITIISEGVDKVAFEWSEGALFTIPPNTPYRHVNLSDSSARLMAQTPLPQLISMIYDDDVIFNPSKNFWRDIAGDDYYSSEGKMYEGRSFPVVWEANFIPDIQQFDNLEVWSARGAGGASVKFPFPHTSMFAHISEFPVGTYKKGHRHGPGANVGILSGEGYSLLWQEGWDDKIKVDWTKDAVYPPPARWYHQHFNTGTEPARYFAIHSPTLGTLKQSGMFNPHVPENQIEYVDEDPMIRKLYDEELAKHELESKMPKACYVDPEFEF